MNARIQFEKRTNPFPVAIEGYVFDGDALFGSIYHHTGAFVMRADDKMLLAIHNHDIARLERVTLVANVRLSLSHLVAAKRT